MSGSRSGCGKGILLLTIAVASMIFSSLLTAHTYQLHVNYAALKAENERLGERCALLASEKVRLGQALENLNSTLTALRENYTALQERCKALNESYATLKAGHALLSEQYEALNRSYAILSEKYAELAQNHDALEKNYTELRLKYEVLEKERDYLASTSSSLARENALLKAENELLTKTCSKLNETLAKALETANSYSTLTTSLPRVLSGGEVEALYPTIDSLGLSTDLWSSIKRIYDYVTATIKYADDATLPRFQIVMTIKVGDKTYIYDVDYDEVQECVQAPTLTLKLKRGDCEDQSILAHVLLDARGRAFCDEIGCLLIVYGSEGARALKERAEELGHRDVRIVKYVSESPNGLKVFVPKGEIYDEKLSSWYSSYRLAHAELFSRKRAVHLSKLREMAMKSGKPKWRASKKMRMRGTKELERTTASRSAESSRRAVQSTISRRFGRRSFGRRS
jgi:predicted nuclease with TOPRIM domain